MVKRILDVSCALILLVFLCPVMILLALAVSLKLGRPIFFVQERAGYRGKAFRMIKFRTMVDRNDCEGNPLPDEQRLTRFGRMLRSTSLDELPELWNVLLGDMSLVGPRPLHVRYLSRYSPEHRKRHDVRPGITGWSQVNGRNQLGWKERFDLDIWYVENRSLWLDLRILWMTIGEVFDKSGINAHGHATMPEFEGLESSSRIDTKEPSNS